MRQRTPQRRSPPVVIWLLLGLVSVTVATGAAVGVWVWQQSEQIQTLEAELRAMREETAMRLAASQSTVATLEGRLTALETGTLALHGGAAQATEQNNQVSQEIDDVQLSVTKVEDSVSTLELVLEALTARVEMLEASGGIASESLPQQLRLSVARQGQSHNLSCESSAASMVAQYHGLSLSEADVLAALPLNDNPHLGFRGNVDGPTGSIEDYGVYAAPILDILNSQGLQARMAMGGLDGIKAAIARGNPVVAWVTYDCQQSTPTTQIIDGQEVTLVPYQHVVVVTGYSTNGVWANDPWDGQEDFYQVADFERALSYFGDMAIEVAAP
jgi:uncharacterized protein YvpB